MALRTMIMACTLLACGLGSRAKPLNVHEEPSPGHLHVNARTHEVAHPQAVPILRGGAPRQSSALVVAASAQKIKAGCAQGPSPVKDGYWKVACVRDYMLQHADKDGPNKFEYKINAVANKSISHYTEAVPKEDRQAMTAQVCFDFCRTVPGMTFFGLTAGRDCYCTPWYKAMASDSSECDAVCEGDPTTMCGGMSKSMIFEMHFCGDTAEDLQDAKEQMGALKKDLEALAEPAAEASDIMQNSASEGEATFSGVDPTATALMRRAKGFAGSLQRAVTPNEELLKTLGSLDTEAEGMASEDFTDAETIKAAEAVVAKIKKANAEAKQQVDKLKAILAKAHPEFYVPEGQKDGALHDGDHFYDVMYFVDKRFEDAPSTCQGVEAADPMLGTFGDCAVACDTIQSTLDGSCVGFSFFPPTGEAMNLGLCFPLKQFKQTTYFSGCGKEDEVPEGLSEGMSLLEEAATHHREAKDGAMGVRCVARLVDFQDTSLKPDPTGKCARCFKSVTEKDCIK